MGEGTKNIMLGTAGHVDHGKTALVKILTGCNTDTLAAEKQRGLTIELGFAPCRMRDERIVGIVDVPGHVDFVRNMVAGAHGVDVVVLVVAADDGVMPQTREHLDILTLMGVRHGLIALTKIDLVDEVLQEVASQEVREFVAGTFLENAPICPVSNITGQGFDVLQAALNDAVEACESRKSDGPFRLWSERSFAIKGFGTVVSGIPVSGTVRLGDTLKLIPGMQDVRVRRLEVYGRDSDVGRAGECVAINLADIERKDISRNHVLTEGVFFEPVSMAEADLHVLRSAGKALKDYAEVHVHVGTAEVMAKIAMLEGKPIPPGENRFVQLRLSQPVSLACGERFVIRGSGPVGRMTTLGGGRILGKSNTRLKRNRPWTMQELQARADALNNPRAWCDLHLQLANDAITIDLLAKKCELLETKVKQCVSDLLQCGKALEVGGRRLVHSQIIDDLGKRVCEVLREFHGDNPTRLGMGRDELASKLETTADIMNLTIARLVEDGSIEDVESVVALVGSGARLNAEDRQMCQIIETRLREAGVEPPLPADLACELNLPAQHFTSLVKLLCDKEVLRQLDAKVILHRETIDKARNVVLDLFGKTNIFTTMEFRDALQASRKVAVPLLDYFDSAKLTVRLGNRRRAGSEAKRLMEKS